MSQPPKMAASQGPIGVFDSGVGGLSVLRELRRALPSERLIYFADSAYCPYGGKPQSQILARCSAVTESLLAENVKLIVVACNTATIAAVEQLRATYPLPFVGMEPAVKPAVAATRSGVVGVLATGAALGGEKFHRLLKAHARGVRVITQPCPGLVEHVERGDVDSPEVRALLGRYLRPLLDAGADVLVLGCTHYPFLRSAIAGIVGPEVLLLDTGEAVARQARRVLEREQLLDADQGPGGVEWRGSGDVSAVIDRLWLLTQSG